MEVLPGTNNLSDETVCNLYFVSCDHPPSADIDITIIAGNSTSPSINLPLLLMRFHNLESKAESFGEDFFHAAKEGQEGLTCGKDFWKVNRSGGSSGRTSNPFDDLPLKFMNQHHASLPRKTSSCKIIQNPDSYTVHWLCAQKGTLDNWLRLNPLMRNVYRRALANNDRTIRADRKQRRRGRGLNN